MTTDRHDQLRATIDLRGPRRHLDPRGFDQARDEVERAYVRGEIGDGDHDDLFNRWLDWRWGKFDRRQRARRPS